MVARRGLFVVLVAGLAQLGCWRACAPFPPGAFPEPPEVPAEAARPPMGPVPAGSLLCSFEQSQRLTASLERDHALTLRALADRSEAAALAMVPLRLQYDGAGQVQAARFRLRGYDWFANSVEQEAARWRLEGVDQAGMCELAVRLPRSEALSDADDRGRRRRRPPSMKARPAPPSSPEDDSEPDLGKESELEAEPELQVEPEPEP